MTETYLRRQEREAVERLESALALPVPAYKEDMGSDVFDPWELFPALYGSYSSDFDKCAIEVLQEILASEKKRDDLGAEMFREMLCTAGFCEYGTSPRVCFCIGGVEKLLPQLIEAWRAYSLIHWGADVCSDEGEG